MMALNPTTQKGEARMKYASEDLMNEHEGILFGLKILEKMAEQLAGNKYVEVDDYKAAPNAQYL